MGLLYRIIIISTIFLSYINVNHFSPQFRKLLAFTVQSKNSNLNN